MFLTSLITLIASAQDKTESGYVGLTIGAGIPSGDFASKDANKASGLAKTGILGDLSLVYFMSPTFSLAASVKTQSNSVDTKPLQTLFSSLYPGINWTVEEASWHSTSISGGIHLNFPINLNTLLYFRVNLGIAYTGSPELTVTGRQGIYTASSIQESSLSNSFYSSLGAGFKIYLTKSMGLIIDADYSKTTPNFKNVKTTYTFVPPTTNNFSQAYGLFNLKAGISFTIKSKKPDRIVPFMPAKMH